MKRKWEFHKTTHQLAKETVDWVKTTAHELLPDLPDLRIRNRAGKLFSRQLLDRNGRPLQASSGQGANETNIRTAEAVSDDC